MLRVYLSSMENEILASSLWQTFLCSYTPPLPPTSSWGEVLSTGLQMVSSCCSSGLAPVPTFAQKKPHIISLKVVCIVCLWCRHEFGTLWMAEGNGQVKHWDFVSEAQRRGKSRQ